MTPRSSAKEVSASKAKSRNGNGANGHGLSEEFDSVHDFPEWSKTLLLLLDYAMVEAVRQRLDLFVQLLEMARLELHERTVARIETCKSSSKKADG